jgi:GDPmannose 4,6-dehydratase
MTLGFEGQGVEERAVVVAVSDALRDHIQPGRVVMRIDPRYFRPADVEALLGDAGKARQKLGWAPATTARQMCAEMVAEDLRGARRRQLLEAHGLAEA